MQTLFENRFTCDKNLYKEIWQYSCFRTLSSLVRLLVFAVVFVLNLLLFFFWSADGFARALNLVAALLALFAALLFVLDYLKNVRLSIRRDKETLGKEKAVEVLAGEELLQTKASDGTSLRVEYRKIKKAARTKSLILLITKANQVIALPKETFSKGSHEKFTVFLMDLGIRLS